MSPHAPLQHAGPLRRAWRWIACGLGLLGVLLPGVYLWLTTALPTPEHLRERAAIGNTRILDRNGQLLYAIPDPLSGHQRPVALDEIPLALRQATVAVEDAGFYQNSGIEVRGIIRAAWANLQSGAIIAGGSTITQQLARGFLLDPQLSRQQSFERKLREAILALKLTTTYSKDEILALYLNQTYYGGTAYGVEAAARQYFDKPARDLDLAESALLAGLPQAPSRYNPLADLETARARQAQVLAAMQAAGSITPEQAVAAGAEPLQLADTRPPVRAPHFVRYVLDALDTWLGPELVVRGGLTITTTLDANLNDTTQMILRRQLDLLADPRGGPDHRAHNGAVVVLEPASGAILVMVGSPDFNDATIQGQVNAALARRQPGSAIKLLTYAAALERGWTPATTILDTPAAFSTRDGRPYEPLNYDRTFHGPLSLREALATSSNVAAVRTLDSIGIPALLDMAGRLGIASLQEDPSRYGLALTLGGGEMTPLELTAAYAAFANQGRQVHPFGIISVTGPQGQELCGMALPCRPQAGATAMNPQVAYLITDILADRYARMRAFGARSVLDVDRPAAAKTGTTTDWRDNWTLGYSPDRAVGVWVGNADGRPMIAVSGISGAGPIWRDAMLAAHRGLPPRTFERPDGIVELPICAEGGMLPSPVCPVTRRERFVEGTQPVQPDTTHVAVRIDPLRGCRAPSGYPADHTVTRIFRVLPAAAEAWAITSGLPRPPVALCMPQADREPSAGAARPSGEDQEQVMPCQPSRCDESITLIAPAAGAIFAISQGVPRERQQLELRAGFVNPANWLIILVDGIPVATFDRPPYRTFWRLEPGSHQAVVQARDEQGRLWQSAPVEFVVTDYP